jgi:hypothetical protein
MPYSDPNAKKENRRRYYLLNRERIAAQMRAYTQSHSEKIKEYQKRYYTEHRERLCLARRVWTKNHRERYKRTQREWRRQKRASSPAHKILFNLRSRIYTAIVRGHKSDTTTKLLGCSIANLAGHLEKSFQPGMTWENYGPVWHLDHIKPCAKFDLTNPTQQRECFHWTNLQPLFAEENLKKGDGYGYGT